MACCNNCTVIRIESPLYKQVNNVGVATPIVEVVDAGIQLLVNAANRDISLETNDIVPVIDALGNRHWYLREFGVSYSVTDQIVANAAVFTDLDVDTVNYDAKGLLAGNIITVPITGLYIITWDVREGFANNIPAEIGWELYIKRNAAYTALDGWRNYTNAVWNRTNNPTVSIAGAKVLQLTAGDTIRFAIFSGFANAHFYGTTFGFTYVGGMA